MNFFENFGAVIPTTEVATKGGLAYMSAGTAIKRAGRPYFEFVDFNGKPWLGMLGGAVVAVDIHIPNTELVQRTWLHVMDEANAPISLQNMTLADVNSARQRCLVKALASVYGVGMSLYLGCDNDGAKAVKLLGLTPDSVIAAATPVVASLPNENATPYIEWGVGLSACRITDPTFYWEVVMWDGMPFREVMNGVLVDVNTVYAGKSLTLSLPLMDANFKPLSNSKGKGNLANVSDWNKSVMRALTKCIAYNTGYGLDVYCMEEFGLGDNVKRRAPRKKAEDTAPAPTEASTVEENAQPVVEAKATETVTEPTPAPVTAEVVAEPEKVEQAAPIEQAAPVEKKSIAADGNLFVCSPEEPEHIQRFTAVTKGRFDQGGFHGLLSVFDSLYSSKKFDEVVKPSCYALLMNWVAATATPDNVPDLLKTLNTYTGVASTRGNYKIMETLDAASRDVIGAKLTAQAFNYGLNEGDMVLGRVPDMIIDAGLAKDFSDVIRLGHLGKVEEETFMLLDSVLTAE